MVVAHPERDIFAGRKPIELPRYTLPEAAHYLKVPTNTVRSWVVGRDYPTASGKRRSRPIIAPADPKAMLLSFGNLTEIYILKAIRGLYRVKLPRIRRAAEFLKKQFRSEHPLLEKNLLTDGKDIFIREFHGLISASEGGQMVIAWIGIHLNRIERDPSGMPIRLFPFTRDIRDNSPRLVAIDPQIGFGQPCIAGTNIPTAILADRHTGGDTVEMLAEDYGRSRREVEEAIRYESRPAA